MHEQVEKIITGEWVLQKVMKQGIIGMATMAMSEFRPLHLIFFNQTLGISVIIASVQSKGWLNFNDCCELSR